ncbi:hypothetical protein [Novipirellula caenicola]|uniref:Uncharacterized protein n=1 Tax=Novipirellula caenicola TaxID=1536901 RepID=A0ABP9W286_9BACT
MEDHHRPLIAMAEESTREIHARICAVESAVRAIGFRADSGHDLICRLIARVAGRETLVRTVAEIAADSAVGISYSYALRCIAELQAYDVIRTREVQTNPTRRRGRPAKTLQVWLNWELIHETNAIESRHVAMQKTAPIPSEMVADELVTKSCRDNDGSMTNSRPSGDEPMTKSCRNAKHTVSENPIPSSPSPGANQPTKQPSATATESEITFESIVDTIRDAGVERVRNLIDEAKQVGMTPAELADAAYIVRHTNALGGGALFDHVRSGGWPISGVKPADVIRAERKQHADGIRQEVAANAPRGTPLHAIAGVTAKRLIAAGLPDHVRDNERAVYNAIHRSPSSNAHGKQP